jgi:hypothetical protein
VSGFVSARLFEVTCCANGISSCCSVSESENENASKGYASWTATFFSKIVGTNALEIDCDFGSFSSQGIDLFDDDRPLSHE